jgi:hypothetical protein
LAIETFAALNLGTCFAFSKADFWAETGAVFQVERVSGFDPWRRSIVLSLSSMSDGSLQSRIEADGGVGFHQNIDEG